MVRRGIACLPVAVMVIATVSTAVAAEKLRGIAGYNVRTVNEKLEKAEKLLRAGDAKQASVYIEAAEVPWKALHKDYKDRFDPNHPEIVATAKRLADAKAKVAAALGKPVEKPDTPPPTTTPPKDLPAAVKYQLTNVDRSLKGGERAVVQGDLRTARTGLGEADRQWKEIEKSYAGKFDPNHAEIAALKQRMAALRAKIDQGGHTVTPPPDTTTPDPATAKRLDARIAYSLKGINGSLDYAEQSLARQNLQGARTSLTGAETKWKQTAKDFAGQYDPKHPQIVAVANRLSAVRSRVDALGGEADAMAKVLPAVLGTIEENGGKLSEAIHNAERAFRGFSSLRGAYRTGREQDLGKVRSRMDELQLLVERANALLPAAHGAARDFRKQFPNPAALKNLVKDGWQAGQKVRQVEAMPARWLELLSREAKDVLDLAENTLGSYEKELRSVASEGRERQQYVAGNAHKWAVDYAGTLAQIVPTAFPELSDEAKGLFPELVKARAQFTARAAPLSTRIAAVAAQVRKARKDLADAERLRLQQARFPKTAYQGGQWREAEGEIRKAWARKIPDKKLVKLAIYAPWEVRTEARWRNSKWVVGTYRYISAHCLGRLASGKLYVYRMTFRSTRQADGTWSPLEHWSVGHVYEILPENAGK